MAIPADALKDWAALKPNISELYVFGSYARGEETSESDLDIAFSFTGKLNGNPLSFLIVNRAAWKAELTKLTGTWVEDLYLVEDVTGPKELVFKR